MARAMGLSHETHFLTARDGMPIRWGFWPRSAAGCGGTVVLLGGRTEFIEKYHPTINLLSQRGFDVFSLDWRGQGLSGRALPDPHKGHVGSYQEYVDDLVLFLNDVVHHRADSPMVVMAHSMGGNVVLRYLAQQATEWDAVVLTAPLVRIHTSMLTEATGRLLSRMASRIGFGGAAIPGRGADHSFHGTFEGNRLTSDPVRFREIQKMIKDDRRLDVHAVTFGWLCATYDAIDYLHAKGVVGRITAPVLITLAEQDAIVSNSATLRFARGIPNHSIATIPGAEHEILQERQIIQSLFWKAFDAFVK